MLFEEVEVSITLLAFSPIKPPQQMSHILMHILLYALKVPNILGHFKVK